jgi:hypothetical protein
MTAEQIQAFVAAGPALRFRPNLDGYFLPKLLADIFAAGDQSKTPLLAGSNPEQAAGIVRARHQ